MPLGTLEHFELDSDALKGNRIHDPHVRDVWVYVPPAGFDDGPFPTVYMLPSHGRTNAYYIAWNQWDERVQDRLDRLITSGTMPPCIVVLPDCWTRFGGSQYLDSEIGNYEQYVINEIVPAVDARYPTIQDYKHRAIVGHSSGGYGALHLAMKHPDVFAAVAARAPDMYWEYTALPAIAQLPLQIEKWGGFAQFIEDIPTIRPKKGDFWMAIHTVMQCMAYGSNPEHPLGFDPPIDEETGELIDEVWQRWLQFDPIRMLDNAAYQDALQSMALLYLEAGKFDSYLLQIGARIFSKKLTTLGIAHEYEEFADGHSDTGYRYDVSLPKVVAAISK